MKQQNHLILSPAVFIFLLCVVQSCTKEPLGVSKPSATATRTDTSQYVQTLQGMMPRSQVHFLQPGDKLIIQGGRIYRAERATNKLVEDWGEFHLPTAGTAAQKPTTLTETTGSPNTRKSGSATLGSKGWVVAEQWQNSNGNTINYFSTTSVVPPLPETAAGQEYALWIGLSPASGGAALNGPVFILQPALAYGFPTKGAAYYQVFTYFIWNNLGGVAIMQPKTISPGTSYKSIIQCTGSANGSYDYLEEIVNPTNGQALAADLPISITTDNNSPIPALNFADIVLEVPEGSGTQITGVNEYPNEPSTYPNSANAVFTNIDLAYGTPGVYNYPSTIGWNAFPVGGDNYFGETATVPSNNNNNSGTPGTVDIWFGPSPAPPQANAVFSAISNASQPVAILFESTTSSYTYNALIAPGSTSFQIPPGTYDVVINSPGGTEYEEIIPYPGTPGTTVSNFGSSTVYTVNNVNFPAGSYAVTVGNNGD
jgi:hypothetical protein